MLMHLNILLIGASLFVATAIAAPLPVLSGVGGNFTAIDMNNKTMQLSDYKNNIVLLAFGYTNCADICPFTLGYLDQVYKKLDTKVQKKVRVLFVTIDPLYDTADHLKVFLSHFNKDFIGITGSRDQVDTIVRQFKAKYQSISNEESTMQAKHIRRVVTTNDEKKEKEAVHLYNHSVTIYLIDTQNETRGISFTGTPKDQLIHSINQLYKEAI